MLRVLSLQQWFGLTDPAMEEALHGKEKPVRADADYQGIHKRAELKGRKVQWQVGLRPGKRRALPNTPTGNLLRQIEQAKARIRAEVEHPLQAIKRQFGYTKVRYRELAKNTAQLQPLLALSKLWMARRILLGAG